MRETIFSSVLLPAPFRPMMPTTSPSLTSKETSFKAQKCSPAFSSGNVEPLNRRSAAHLRASAARTPLCSNESRVSTYSFDKFSIWRMGSTVR